MKPAPPTSNRPAPKVSVIIPARDEQANIGRCLRSILAQQGVAFQVIVVDDHSTDRTAEIARRLVADVACETEPVDGPDLPAVGKCGSGSPLPLSAQPPQAILIEARSPLPTGWTGKANALASALPHAKGEWLLFTDADTEHVPGSLAAAVQEAERYRADLFSLSPEQQVEGFFERAIMPVIFAELATTFRPRDVSDPLKPVAAANGQYLLIRLAVYQAIGGHAAVAGEVLEDVALARRAKAGGYRLRFRIGKGMVRTRMYRGWRQMREGWTKNLALLFPDAHRLACRRMVEFAALAAMPSAACLAKNRAVRYPLLVASAAAWGNFLLRVRKAHFDPLSTALAACGLPLFAGLLVRSARAHREGRVEWKGRNYCISAAAPASLLPAVTSAIFIRRATADDVPGILRCLAEAFEPFRDRYTPAAFTDTVLTPETLRQRLSSMSIFVATADCAEIVGTIACNVLSLREGYGEGHIRGMAVRPKWQGFGVAARLLSVADAELRRQGCSLISLDTTAPLERAMHFYEKNGFRRSGRVTDFFGMPLYEFVKSLEP